MTLQFCEVNGIRHILVAAYHPKSNGLAERAVKIFKDGLKKMSEGTMEDWISLHVSNHTTEYNSDVSCRIVDGKETEVSVGSVETKFSSESRKETIATKEEL